ncbi:MAG TPA: SLBB domain-containing protein [Rectinema sp.]|mgnify:CR=1 FL=1|nr:SLBB domain-containing protein [Rectinema sp.]
MTKNRIRLIVSCFYGLGMVLSLTAQTADQALLTQQLLSGSQSGTASGLTGNLPTVAPQQPTVNQLTTSPVTTNTSGAAQAQGAQTAPTPTPQLESPSLSTIENMFALMASNLGTPVQNLTQFGYSLFEAPTAPSLVSIGDDYILGPGDSLVLYLWGDPVDIKELSSSYLLTVDRNGAIFFPPVGQVSVWGQDLGSVKSVLKAMLDRRYKKLEMNLTLSTLRQFPVFVSGYAGNPGTVLANGADTVLSVLSRAGGILKTGSLRSVVLTRQDKNAAVQKIEIDLYQSLLEGTPLDLRVREGDSIFIPGIGPVVALAGELKRPGIYELKGASTMAQALSFAGGMLPSSRSSSVTLLRFDAQGKVLQTADVADKAFVEAAAGDGDFVYFGRVSDLLLGQVQVSGAIKYPGRYEVRSFRTLKELLEKAQLLPETNLFYGRVYRTDQSGRDRSFAFSPSEVLGIATATKTKAGVGTPGSQPIAASASSEESISTGNLSAPASEVPLSEFDRVVLYRYDDTAIDAELDRFADTLMFSGPVKYPGFYLYKEGMMLSNLLAENPLLLDANPYYAEIVRRGRGGKFEYYTFSPEGVRAGVNDMALAQRDSIRFVKKGEQAAGHDFDRFPDVVQLTGEVARPEVYALRSGMKLSEVLTKEQVLLDTNLNYGELTRLREDGKHEYVTFRPGEVLSGSYDIELGPRDVIRLVKVGYVASSNDVERFRDVVSIEGPVEFVGSYAWREGMSLRSLVSLAKIKLEANGVYAEIVRPLGGGKYEYVTFAPREVVRGEYDIVLKAMDKVMLYSTGVQSASEITPDLGLFLEVVTVSGEVRYVGPYARTPSLRLSDVVTPDQVLETTNLDYAELTRLKADGSWEYVTFAPKEVLEGKYDIALRAKDSIRFLKKTSFGGVGEVPNFEKFADVVLLQGEVARPEVYALRAGLKLSGIVTREQVLLSTNLNYGEVTRLREDGKNEYVTFRPKEVLEGTWDLSLGPRDVVRLVKIGYAPEVPDFDKFSDAVVIRGPVEFSGLYAWREGMKLSELLSLAKPLLDTNQVYAEIERSLGGGKSEYVTFAPREVVSGEYDAELKARDRVQLYYKAAVAKGNAQGAGIEATAAAPVVGQAGAVGQGALSANGSVAAVPAGSVVGPVPASAMPSAVPATQEAASATGVVPTTVSVSAPGLPTAEGADLGHYLEVVTVSGEVRYIGPYARTPSLRLSDVVTSDQVLETTNLDYAELTRLKADGSWEYVTFAPKEVLEGKYDLALRAKDSIRFLKKTSFGGVGEVPNFEKFADVVLLQGEVARPEVYALRAGLKLSGIVTREQVLLSTNLNYGEVTRLREDGKNEYVTFRPKEVLEGTWDLSLGPRDVVRLVKIGYAPEVPDFDKFSDAVVIRGPVEFSGLYAWREGMKLSELLSLAKPLLDTNQVYAEIERSLGGGKSEYVTFAPKEVLEGKYDIALRAKDSIRFLKKTSFGGIGEEPNFEKFKGVVQLTGEVARPEVYALRPGMKLSEVLTKEQVLLDTNLNYGELTRLREDGKHEYVTFRPGEVLSGSYDIELGPRDVIRLVKVGYVASSNDVERFRDVVSIEGPVEFVGSYAWREGMSLRSLVSLAKIKLEANGVYAEVVRPLGGGKYEYVTFAPREVVRGEYDIVLKAMDKVRLYSTVVAQVATTKQGVTAEAVGLAGEVVPGSAAGEQGGKAQEATSGTSSVAGSGTGEVPVAPSVGQGTSGISPDLGLFLEVVTVTGTIRYQGPYARTPSLKLSSIVSAEQILEETNLEYAELTRLRVDGTPEYETFAPKEVLEGKYDLALRAKDSIRFLKKTSFGGIGEEPNFEKFKGVVQLTGEVARPEVYALRPGMKLSEVLTKEQVLLDTNLNYGELTRLREDGKHEYVTFRPGEVLSGSYDIELGPRDVIRLVKVGYVASSNDVERFRDVVSIEGPVEFVGSYAWREGMSLRSLVSLAKIKLEANGVYAEVVRPLGGGKYEYVTFAPREVVRGEYDIVLKAMDKVMLYTTVAPKVAHTAQSAMEVQIIEAPTGEGPAIVPAPAQTTIAPSPSAGESGIETDTGLFLEVVYVSGKIRYEGPYARTPKLMLSSVVTPDQILQNTNLDYAELTRRKADGSWEYTTFSPRKVLNGSYDLPLRGMDSIRFVPAKYLPEKIDFDKFSNAIAIVGIANFPGLYSFSEPKMISQVIGPEQLLSTTDIYYGEIERWKEGGRREYLTFNPIAVLQGHQDFQILQRDIIRFVAAGDTGENHDFSKYPDTVLFKGSIRYPGRYAWYEGMKLSDIVHEQDLLIDTETSYAEIHRHTETKDTIINFAPDKVVTKKTEIALSPRDNVIFYPKYYQKPVSIAGEVANPKIIPYYDQMELSSILRSVTLTRAYSDLKAEIKRITGETTAVYLESYLKEQPTSKIILSPGDSITIRALLPDEHLPVVIVRGEVSQPQTLPFVEGMKLADALSAAGGYEATAYPKGLVLIRKSVATAQQTQVDRLIAQLEAATAAGTSLPTSISSSQASDAASIVNMQVDLAMQKAKLGNLKQLYKEGFGRISLDIPDSLEKLSTSPANIRLERDDLIYIPKVPTYVLVSGEVSSQNVVLYRDGMRVRDAITESGWLSNEADLAKAYIIRASGKLDSTEGKGFLFFKPNILNYKLEPGDTVYVPMKSAKVSVAWAYVRDSFVLVSSILTSALTAKTLLGL